MIEIPEPVMTHDDRAPIHSEISFPTVPRLRVRFEDETNVWYYDDASGNSVRLDLEALLLDYGQADPPDGSVSLHIVNETPNRIELEVSALGSETVVPRGSQTLERSGGKQSWECDPGDGDGCNCGPGVGACQCSGWSITGSYELGRRPIADPTFKVRWKAHGDPPSSP